MKKGKHEQEGKKNIFPNVVVAVLLLVGVLISASQIWEYHRLDRAMPSDVLQVIFGFIISELGILAGRQAIGSDVLQWFKKNGDDTSSSDDSDIFGGSV